MSCPYAVIIKECLKEIDRSEVDPRHVEGYLRGIYGTLDHLPRVTFEAETALIVLAIDEDPELAEEVAKTYGF